jgi:hypothetical protein
MAVHVIPNDDERPHRRHTRCPCEPEVIYLDPDTGRPWEGSGPMVMHNAFDSRETVEELTDEQLAPGKSWTAVETDMADDEELETDETK